MSRLSGKFPFPVTSAATVDVPISLSSGGTVTIPAGNWLVCPGANTRLQWMDPVNLQWRTMQGQNGGGMISSDGCNYRLINITGTVIGAAVTAAGSGGINGIGAGATGVTVAIAPSNTTPGIAYNATAYAVVGGAVAAPTVTQGGSGFVAVPLIICDPPPIGGVQATATALVSAAGAISGVNLDNPGAGYTSPPQWYIFPEPAVYYGAPIAGVGPDLWPAPGLVHPSCTPQGSIYQPNISAQGALLTSNPLTGSGTVTAIMILDPGGNYSGTAPAVTITGAGAATGTVTLGAAPTTDRSFLQSRVQ